MVLLVLVWYYIINSFNIQFCIRIWSIMKLTYEKIKIEIQEINQEDVITTSSPAPIEETEEVDNMYCNFFDLS